MIQYLPSNITDLAKIIWGELLVKCSRLTVFCHSHQDKIPLPTVALTFTSLISSCQASKEDINNAFRRLSRIYHPDKHAQDPAMLSKAETQFTKIKMAHEGRKLL